MTGAITRAKILIIPVHPHFEWDLRCSISVFFFGVLFTIGRRFFSLFRLAIALEILRFTACDFPFGSFKPLTEEHKT